MTPELTCGRFTRYFIGVMLLTVVISCERPNSEYYLSHQKLGTPFNRRHHYRLFKNEGDSMRIWILNHDYNAGYFSWKKTFAVPKKVGKFGIIEFTDLQENSITCEITEDGTERNLGKIYLVDKQDAYEILSILKMLQINYQMEKYVRETAKCAKPNTLYFTSNYSADEKCSELNPSDFEVYYSKKMKEKALEAIGKIDNEDCL
jgi:hypothetical protein